MTKGDPCCTRACGVRGPYKSVPSRSSPHCTSRPTASRWVPARFCCRRWDLGVSRICKARKRDYSPCCRQHTARRFHLRCSATSSAAKSWRDGDDALAAIHLAHAALPRPVDPDEAARRLFITDAFIKSGTSPIGILQALGLGGSYVEAVAKYYNELEPRVPAGNGILSGRWTKILSFLGDLTATQAGQLWLWATRLLGAARALPDDAIRRPTIA